MPAKSTMRQYVADNFPGLPSEARSFMELLKNNEKAESTLYDYGCVYSTFFLNHQLTLGSINTFLSSFSGGTRTKYRAMLKSLADHNEVSIKWDKVARPKPGREAIVALTKRQQDDIYTFLLNTTKGYAYLFRFMLETGLRPGEVFELAADDLHFDSDGDPYLRVRTANSHSKDGRNVTLSGVAQAMLKKLELPIDLSPYMFSQALHLAEREIGGLPNLTPRVLRRTYATTTLDKGVDVGTVAKLMGHNSPATTLLYDGATPESLKHRQTKARKAS